MKNFRFLYILLISLILPMSISAQGDSEILRVYFRQGSSSIDLNYRDNSSTLDTLAKRLSQCGFISGEGKGCVRIASSVSPEGSDYINARLVKQRAKSISDYISKNLGVEVGLVVGSMGKDWGTLIDLVENDINVPYREEVLDILYNTPESITRNGNLVNERQSALRRLRNGIPYNYIVTKFYPELRYAEAYAEIWIEPELNLLIDGPIRFSNVGGKGDISYEKNVEDDVIPEVISSADWISSITVDQEKINYTVEINTTSDVRMSTICVRCYGDVHDVVVEQAAGEPVWSISYDKDCHFGAEGGRGKLTYKTNSTRQVIPDVVCKSEWIDSLKVSNGVIEYMVLPNTFAEPRKDTITAVCFGKPETIVISQEAAEPELTIVTTCPRNFKSRGGKDTLEFKSNTPESIIPEVSTDSRWIRRMNATTDDISYRVARNYSYEDRSATITVEGFGNSHEILINQAAAEERQTPLYIALKTNALYDLALIPNIGIEYNLGKRFSIAANAVFAWWHNDDIFWYWRTYGADLTLRYWFGKKAKEKPLTGHHVGIYGHALTYDFEAGGRGYIAAKPSVGYGVEYGYSLPIAKRLNLDFNIGFGYFGGEFEEYLPIDGHYVWQVTKYRHWVGPTKMEVSLSWLLGRGNVNKGKGGKR